MVALKVPAKRDHGESVSALGNLPEGQLGDSSFLNNYFINLPSESCEGLKLAQESFWQLNLCYISCYCRCCCSSSFSSSSCSSTLSAALLLSSPGIPDPGKLNIVREGLHLTQPCYLQWFVPSKHVEPCPFALCCCGAEYFASHCKFKPLLGRR